jgi:hypothetical protein
MKRHSRRELQKRARTAESYLEDTRRRLDNALTRLIESRSYAENLARQRNGLELDLIRMTHEVDTCNAIINDLREQLSATQRAQLLQERKHQRQGEKTL